LSRKQPWLVHPTTSATTGTERMTTAFDIMASVYQRNRLAMAESGINVRSLLTFKMLSETRNHGRKNSAERTDYEEELALLKT
jgi:hypothetical protein